MFWGDTNTTKIVHTVLRSLKKRKRRCLCVLGCTFNTVPMFALSIEQSEHTENNADVSKRKQLYHFYLWSFAERESNRKGKALSSLSLSLPFSAQAGCILYFINSSQRFRFLSFCFTFLCCLVVHIKYLCRLNYDGWIFLLMRFCVGLIANARFSLFFFHFF